MGHCYKFTINTQSPAPRTDEGERSGLMPVLPSEAQGERARALRTWGWRLESRRGAGTGSCSSTCLGSWVSWYLIPLESRRLWGTDNGAGSGLAMHVLWPHASGSMDIICLLNFCLCILPLPSPPWPDMQRINLLWCFIWLLGGGHCCPSFLFPKYPYSEEVI